MKRDLGKMVLRKELTNFIDPSVHNGQAVEIGVMHGVFSEQLLQSQSIKLLYSVDSWAVDLEKVQAGTPPSGWHDYLKAVYKLGAYEARSVILKMSSVRAAQLLRHEQFCLIYIDANHTYEAVREDIRVWWPLVQPGGIFAGHDYSYRLPGVIQAVDEFIITNGFQLFVIPETSSDPKARPSWCCFKPQE